jgi:ADP-ribose pyrophosphatase YjhB (NUDIX family)
MSEIIDDRLKAVGDCLYRVAVKIILVRDKQLLLVKEDAGWFSLPGGGWDYDEELRAALDRELREEIDLGLSDVELEEQPVFIAHGGVFAGMPRLFLLFRADLHESASPKSRERTHRWVTGDQLAKTQLGPNTEYARPFLTKLLRDR